MILADRSAIPELETSFAIGAIKPSFPIALLTACVRLERTIAAENGATTKQLMAIFGWDSIRQAEIYTRAAEQKRMAADAHLIEARDEPRTKQCPTEGRSGTFSNFCVEISATYFGGGAQGRNRTTDTAIFSRMLYQLSYLGISCGPDKRRACRAGRFIVALDPAVHLASLSASQGVADPQIPAESALFCVHVGVRQAQHNVEPESQRSGRRHGSATSKKAARRLGPACRRSEKAAPCERRLLSLQRH